MDKSLRSNTKFISLFKGLIFSYIVTAVIILLLSFLSLKLELPNIVLSGGIVLSYILSTFLGGLIVGKVVDVKKYLWGFLLGVFYFMIIMIISIAINKATGLPLANMFVVFVLCSLSGMIGGMVS
ncbi:MAG TPA: TIGR04086 family membrane protein [Clostridiales bacterium]|nr:TIGR04086 family membrane protein [Clostridiales bacterium]